MPRLPVISHALLAEVVRQLRYAPAAAARRHVEGAERLLAMVVARGGEGRGGESRVVEGGPDQVFPESFIWYQIVGTATDAGGGGSKPASSGLVNVPADDLRRWLPRVIERLSHRAAYTRAELEKTGEHWLTSREVASAFELTSKQIALLRSEGGLSGRRVSRLTSGKGKERGGVMFAQSAVRRVLAQMTPAAGKTKPRKSKEARERFVSWAMRYRRRTNLNDAVIARRLAKRFGVSEATARRWLPSIEEGEIRKGRPARGSSDATKRRQSRRNWLEGVSIHADAPAEIAGLSTAELENHVQRARETGCSVKRAELEGEEDLVAAVAAAMLRSWPDANIEKKRAMGYWASGVLAERWRRGARGAGGRVPTGRGPGGQGPERQGGAVLAEQVDAIETLLRLRVRLKRLLVLGEGMMMLRAIEVQFGKGILELPRPTGEVIWKRGMLAIARGVTRHNPMRGGRLAGPAGLELTSELVKVQGEGAAMKINAAGGPDKSRSDWRDWADEIEPWQRRVDLTRREMLASARLKPLWAQLLGYRYGIDAPSGPMGLAEIAKATGKPTGTVTRSLRVAVTQLRAVEGD